MKSDIATLLEDMREAFLYVSPKCGEEMADKIESHIRSLEANLRKAVEALKEIAKSEWSTCHECEGRCELVSKAEQAITSLQFPQKE